MVYKNLAYGIVLTPPSPATSGTSLVLNSGQGARFPDADTQGIYYCTVCPAGEDPTPANSEIIKVTADSTDTFTIVRAQRGTTARAIVAGDRIFQGNYAEDMSHFWQDVPGIPTRVSDTQFTLTDTGNANKYDLLLKKGVILKWDESGTTNIAMVISSSYATNTVTVNIVGDSLSIGFTLMKYCIQMAQMETFIIPGTLATGTDLAKTWYTPQGVILISADAYVKTAGTTNPTTFDINDDGVTKFTTKPSIASAATSDIDNVADTPTTEVAAGSLVTIDIDAVSTTPPVESYIYLFYFPSSWLYRN